MAAGLDRLDAQWLLLHALGTPLRDRAWLMAHADAPLTLDQAAHFAHLCQRRLNGEPVAYLTGKRGFYGLTLHVDARVLDPRPDTENLVDWALDLLRHHHSGGTAQVLDLGTGSGAVALAIQHQCPSAQVWAVDASPDALAVARANAQRLQLPIQCIHNHWLREWPARQDRSPPPAWAVPMQFDLIVSNPPYLRADDPHLPALHHEPRAALVAGLDGLDDLREIVASAAEHLRPEGWLLLEHGFDQSTEVAALLRAHGYESIDHRRDLGGHVRCTGGRRPANPLGRQAQVSATATVNSPVG